MRSHQTSGEGSRPADAAPPARDPAKHDLQQRRSTFSAILAGLGSTGSLVAAAALAAAAVTGSIAFDAWPGPPSGSGDAEVRLAVPDVPAAVTAAAQATTSAASSAAQAAQAAAGSEASPGGTPPRPGQAGGSGGAGPAPTSTAPRSVTTPGAAGGVQGQSTGGGQEQQGEERGTGGLDDATELAGRELGTGVQAGTGDLAGGIGEDAPRTANVVRETGEASGEAVSAAAEVVAEALRVLPLDGASAGGGGGR